MEAAEVARALKVENKRVDALLKEFERDNLQPSRKAHAAFEMAVMMAAVVCPKHMLPRVRMLNHLLTRELWHLRERLN